MKKLERELTPEQYQNVCIRWRKMSSFGFVPFVLIIGFAGFLLISFPSFLHAWMDLRAVHFSYQWSLELRWENIAFKSITLAGTCMLAGIYWFSTKSLVERYSGRSGDTAR